MSTTWVAAAALAVVVAQSMGAAGKPATLAASAVAIGSVVSFLPLLVKPQVFGVAVVGVSGARLLLVLGIALGFSESQGFGEAKRGFWLAVLAGAGLILIVEAIAAAYTLARLDRERNPRESKNSQSPALGKPPAGSST